MLVDILTDRFKLTNEVRTLVRKTNIPNLSTFMGKSVLDETEISYIGDYNGDASNKEVQQFVQTCDLVLHIGAFYNEINSGKHTLYNGIHPDSLIIMNHENIIIGSTSFDVSFVHILPKIVSNFNPSKLPQFTIPRLEHDIEINPSKTAITQSQLMSSLQNFIQPQDTIVVDTCSVMFGLPDLRFPKDVKLIGQHFYLSIGMALPCSFGVAIANREMGRTMTSCLTGNGLSYWTLLEEVHARHQSGLTKLKHLIKNLLLTKVV
ncbi:hypothetical protein KL936_005083 [Ogataea polymorpha]|nr:hypothetical protein KL936_005083 [Ogataea polymorpha]